MKGSRNSVGIYMLILYDLMPTRATVTIQKAKLSSSAKMAGIFGGLLN